MWVLFRCSNHVNVAIQGTLLCFDWVGICSYQNLCTFYTLLHFTPLAGTFCVKCRQVSLSNWLCVSLLQFNWGILVEQYLPLKKACSFLSDYHHAEHLTTNSRKIIESKKVKEIQKRKDDYGDREGGGFHFGNNVYSAKRISKASLFGQWWWNLERGAFQCRLVFQTNWAVQFLAHPNFVARLWTRISAIFRECHTKTTRFTITKILTHAGNWSRGGTLNRKKCKIF